MKAEYRKETGCLQSGSAEHEGCTGAQSIDSREVEEQGGASLLEEILNRDNLNRAYKRVKANKGAPGIDGMTVEDALPWLKEHREELLESIRQGKYKPQPVRRKEIPKPDGGVRKLGIPSIERLNEIVSAWHLHRNSSQKGINWRFNIDNARNKLKHLYPEIKF